MRGPLSSLDIRPCLVRATTRVHRCGRHRPDAIRLPAVSAPVGVRRRQPAVLLHEAASGLVGGPPLRPLGKRRNRRLGDRR